MKTRLNKSLLTFFSLTLFAAAIFFVAPNTAAAGVCVCNGVETAESCNSSTECSACGQNATIQCKDGTGTSSGNTSGSSSGTVKSLDNPMAGVCGEKVGAQCVQLIIGNVIKAALGIVGSLALLVIMWGGFLWLTSMGNSEKVEKGKNAIVWATIGLALIFGAYALTSFIINQLLNAK
jgi:hypothetical protein